jgi:hypothetical protein
MERNWLRKANGSASHRGGAAPADRSKNESSNLSCYGTLHPRQRPTVIASQGVINNHEFVLQGPTSAPDDPHYSSQVIMLIDERTQSQREYTGLFLRSRYADYFVGSSTAGANGDVTYY